jgi:hypothetical protein
MKSYLIILPAALLVAVAFLIPFGATAQETAPNQLSDQEKKEGWVLLFDGHSTKGWHRWGQQTAGEQWEVMNGAIRLDKSKGEHGDLVTDTTYGDFDLKLDWKISPKGNSGVLFYVQEDTVKYKETFYTGLEMQVLDNNGHPDGKIHKHRAADLYDLIAGSSEPVKPVGEWNQVEIYSRNGYLKLFINGVNVVSTTLWDEHWKELVAGSKFKDWHDFGNFHTGKISLQDHDEEVWFRNIKIRKL